MKEIYKVRINSLVKDIAYFTSFSNESKNVIQHYNDKITELTDEITDIASKSDFTPNEKNILINERLVKIEEIDAKASNVYTELQDKYNNLMRDKEILITMYLDNNPQSNESTILTEIENEMKRLL
jgi:hypothetical protein